MKNLLLTLTVALFSLPLMSQPNIAWQKSYGGTGRDFAKSVIQTNDGGYIVLGETGSVDGDISGNLGAKTLWVLKISSSGAIEWQKLFGDPDYLYTAMNIRQTSDGGYILMSWQTKPFVSSVPYESAIWVLKLNDTGIVEWENTPSGLIYPYDGAIRQTTDGGYILTTTARMDSMIFNDDIYIVKLNTLGEILWQKHYGGSLRDYSTDIQQTNDGGYIVVGGSESKDGDVIGSNLMSEFDFWVVRLDHLGELLWQKTFDGIDSDIARSIQETVDGGFIVAGDMAGEYGLQVPFYNTLILKLNSVGAMEWQKTLEGSGKIHLRAIRQTNDGSYIAFGETSSFDGDVIENYGFTDCWVLKLSETGETKWLKILGGSGEDFGRSIEQTVDGGYILAGITDSFDGDVTENAGLLDAWIIKLSPESVPTAAPSTQAGTLQLFPNPAQQSITITLPETEVAFSLSITDILGRELSRQTVQNGTPLDVSALPNGIYCATAFTSAGKVFVRKFNIQKG